MLSDQLPLVTVVTLVYNTGNHIIGTLDSIRNQTYENIEHIIIDDCSSDNSVDIITKWIRENNYNCKFIKHDVNKGICASLNEAIKLSKGIYFSAIGDDIMMPYKIEKDVHFLELNPKYPLCYSNMIIRNVISGDEQPYIAFASSNYFKKLLECEIRMATPSHMYRTKIFNEVGLYDETLSFEDLDMVLRIADKYPIGFQNYFSVVYCRRNMNFLEVKGQTYFEEKDKIIRRWKHLPNFWRYRNSYKLEAFEYYSHNNRRMALKYLLPSLTLSWKRRLYGSLLHLLLIWK